MDPELTAMGEKGQVVIPKRIRDALGIGPRAKFIVFGRGDYIVLKRLELPEVQKEMEGLFRSLDASAPRLSEEEVAREVQASRRNRKGMGDAKDQPTKRRRR